jgi:hypothetical protein
MKATRKVVGVEPLTCPPVTSASFPLHVLKWADFVYFDLHGIPNDPVWMGDDRLPALTAKHLFMADLSNTVVFATNCYLADQGSPMLHALLNAGAEYVIGGDGKNWAMKKSPGRADLLGKWFLMFYRLGLSPEKALAIAKQRLKASLIFARSARKKETIKDTLEFRLYTRKASK